MNILVVTKGFPHPESEDAIQKVYLLIQKLVQKNKAPLGYDLDCILRGFIFVGKKSITVTLVSNWSIKNMIFNIINIIFKQIFFFKAS